MIILRPWHQSRFIAKWTAALTKQPVGTLQVLKAYEQGIFLPLAKQIHWGVWNDSQWVMHSQTCNSAHSGDLALSLTVITASLQP